MISPSSLFSMNVFAKNEGLNRGKITGLLPMRRYIRFPAMHCISNWFADAGGGRKMQAWKVTTFMFSPLFGHPPWMPIFL